MESAGTGTKHLGSRGPQDLKIGAGYLEEESGDSPLRDILHTTVRNYKVGRGTSQVRS